MAATELHEAAMLNDREALQRALALGVPVNRCACVSVHVRVRVCVCVCVCGVCSST